MLTVLYNDPVSMSNLGFSDKIHIPLYGIINPDTTYFVDFEPEHLHINLQ